MKKLILSLVALLTLGTGVAAAPLMASATTGTIAGIKDCTQLVPSSTYNTFGCFDKVTPYGQIYSVYSNDTLVFTGSFTTWSGYNSPLTRWWSNSSWIEFSIHTLGQTYTEYANPIWTYTYAVDAAGACSAFSGVICISMNNNPAWGSWVWNSAAFGEPLRAVYINS